jgi:hypothetical protein
MFKFPHSSQKLPIQIGSSERNENNRDSKPFFNDRLNIAHTKADFCLALVVIVLRFLPLLLGMAEDFLQKFPWKKAIPASVIDIFDHFMEGITQ